IGNLSLIIIAIATLLYYFGKLIGDVKVEKYEKTDYYVEGVLFSLICIMLPLVPVLLLTQYANLYIPFLPSLFLQIIILGCLWLSAFAHTYLRQHGALSKFRKLVHEKVEKLKKEQHLVAIIEEKVKNSTKKDLTEIYSSAFYKVPIKVFGNVSVLLLFSFVILWSSYSCISPDVAFLPSTILLSVLTFLNMTFLALTYGYANAYYPPAKIVLENGNEINGKVLKFGEFVYILKENEEKKLFINKDKIVYIEESLYKGKEENEPNQED
ncbi:MAG: hypothetical protein K6T73_10975, partial [Candidatus Bathyarchaeota archaeon]|nr:hypothetical protein [Candidatus Bathyarchaeota archaeon]